MEIRVSWFKVADMEAAKRFYGEVLGLQKTFEMPGWTMFSDSETGPSIGLSAEPKDSNETGAVVVLRVDDIETSVIQLSKAGIHFEGQEEIPGIVKLANFRDPSGNRLQIMQRLIER